MSQQIRDLLNRQMSRVATVTQAIERGNEAMDKDQLQDVFTYLMLAKSYIDGLVEDEGVLELRRRFAKLGRRYVARVSEILGVTG